MNQKTKNNLIQLPIDQYGRYFIVSSIIKELASKEDHRSLKILDIGGYKGAISRFFDDNYAKVTIIDLYDSNEQNYVKGSALDMPFKDNSFDYVVSFEVFEHIPRKDREQFIKEAIRVSSGPVLLTAPFSGEEEEVLYSEKLLDGFWKKLHKQNHKWLKEHIDFKTPKTEDIELILKNLKQNFQKIGNNDLLLWNLMLCLNFVSTLYRPSGKNEIVEEFYNRHMNILESNTDSYYRYIYIIGEESNKKFKSLNKAKVSRVQKRKTTYDLINLVFTQLADDISTIIKEKDNEITKLSNELEGRIQAHDHLVEELNKIHNSRSWKIAQKITKGTKR